jgi:hypothetical protein
LSTADRLGAALGPAESLVERPLPALFFSEESTAPLVDLYRDVLQLEILVSRLQKNARSSR